MTLVSSIRDIKPPDVLLIPFRACVVSLHREPGRRGQRKIVRGEDGSALEV